jgi:hypothetical protein
LKTVFGNQLVVVTIHAGYWTTTNASGSFTYDFKTAVGTDLYTSLIPSTQPFPTGTVNRKQYGNLHIVDYPNWGSKIDTLLQAAPDAIIKLTPSYNAISRIISAETKTSVLRNLTGDVSLSLLYTEDSIVNWQAFPIPPAGQGNTANYIHRHVLRGALNGSWGDIIGTNVNEGQVIAGSYTGVPIASDINPLQVYVVAILFNTSTKEVIQVEEQKLLP